MRLYAVALITWAATVIASSESNVANLSNEQAVGYTEYHDLPTKQIVQPYVTRGVEIRNSERTEIVDGPDDDAANDARLSRSTVDVDSEREPNDVSTTESSTSELIYATPLVETNDEYSYREHLGEESGYAIPEDVLLVENAGSFGQRVRQDLPPVDRAIARTTVRTTESGRRGEPEYTSFRKSFSSTASPLQNEGNYRKVRILTQEPPSLASKEENDSTDDSPSSSKNFSKTSGSETTARNSDGNVDVVDSTESSTSSNTNVAPNLENDVVPEYLPKPQARIQSSSRTYNGTEDATKKPTEKPIESTENVATTTTTTTKPVEIRPLQLTRFSGPIVVPELSDRGARGVVIDYTDDNDTSFAEVKSVEHVDPSLEIDVESSKEASNSIITSSMMLNPLQVGITLMNANEADLLGDSVPFAATETKDYLQDEPQRSVDLSEKLFENRGNRSNVDYKNENFQQAKERKNVEIVTPKVPDNTVEIQKSIELYHTAPVQEIHYPVEYIQQTSNLGVIESNNIGSVQRSKYGQDQRSELRSNYDPYRGNDIVDRSVIKAHAGAASAFPQKLNRQEYNALEDNTGNPVASSLIAEYSSSVNEQAPFESLEQQPLQYNDVKPVLLVANQYDDALYEQSNVRHTLNGNDAPHHVKLGSAASTRHHELTSEFAKPYVSSTHQEQQQPRPLTQSSHQLIEPQQHSYRSPPEVRRPEATQLLLKIIPEGSPADAGFLVPIPRPYPIEKIIEKTVHVPHPIEIEKVIEKKVPQPYPVHVPVDRVVEKQIRVPHLYPIHVERVIEKRVPYMVQRLLVQQQQQQQQQQQPSLYPMHVRLPTTYSAQHASSLPIIEKSTADKLAAAAAAAASSRPPRPYRADAERPVDVVGAGSIETTKFGKYHPRPREPVFAGESLGSGIAGGIGALELPQQLTQLVNASQFYADPYGIPTRLSTLQYDYNSNVNNAIAKNYIPLSNVRLVILPKKFVGHHVMLRPHTTTSSPSPYATLPVSYRRQIVYNLLEKDKSPKDEYVGPVPPRKTYSSQAKAISSAKQPLFSTLSVTQSPATTAAQRRPRQPDKRYPGSFRQSKMEYGFKPPMIPSVQYDENTASKVDN